MDLYKSDLLSSFPGLRHGFISNFTPKEFDLLLKGCGLSAVRTVKQVHGDRILKISNEKPAKTQGDSLYTGIRGLGVGVYSADCVPIIYFEQQRGTVGVIHAGWRGTLKKITGKTFSHIQKELNCDGLKIHVAIGPCIEAKCYEVGEKVASQFMEEFDRCETFLTKKSGDKYFLDLKEANICQLRSAGISNISALEKCTFCEPNLPSYRRDGEHTGRILSFIGMAA